MPLSYQLSLSFCLSFSSLSNSSLCSYYKDHAPFLNSIESGCFHNRTLEQKYSLSSVLLLVFLSYEKTWTISCKYDRWQYSKITF